MARRFGLVGSSLALVFALTSCGGGATTVAVTLQEFSVLPEESEAPAGEVTFEATNEGPDDPHELVVARSDLAPDALPTAEDGSVDEEGEGVEVIGEIAEFAPGATETGTFDLEAGIYVLFCNVVEELEGGEVEAHYSLGMRAPFVVE